MTTFEQLGICPQILTALREQGYREPTPIQKKAIPLALAGRDVLGCAQTGSGKTAAFAVPILQRLSAAPRRERHKKPCIRSLILTPTRELALQIQESFEAYGARLPLRVGCIMGGVNQKPQEVMLEHGVDILIATPGRLNDLIGQGFVDLSALEIFVLDEADRMLDMGFWHDVKKVLSHLPEQKQTLLFSATMPKEIVELINTLLHNYERVAVDPVSSAAQTVEQRLYLVDKKNKTDLLLRLVREENVFSALVFTRTKHGADKLVRQLHAARVTAEAIHGNKSQAHRQRVLTDFKEGDLQLLIATDIAARGIDISGLSHVFNYDLPQEPELYVHRIGRTGRAGKDGIAISFCCYPELEQRKDIEKLLGHPIPVVEDHPFPMEDFTIPVKQPRPPRKPKEAPAPQKNEPRRESSAPKKQDPPKQKKPAPKPAFQPAAKPAQKKPPKPAPQPERSKRIAPSPPAGIAQYFGRPVQRDEDYPDRARPAASDPSASKKPSRRRRRHH